MGSTETTKRDGRLTVTATLHITPDSPCYLAQVTVKLDYDYAESLLRRAERINAHVEAGTLPERIPFNEEVCPRCPFYALCLPDFEGKDPIAFLEDETVEFLDRSAQSRGVQGTADPTHGPKPAKRSGETNRSG